MPIEISWQQRGKEGAAGAGGANAGHKRVLEGQGPFRIGRSANGDIVLEHAQVSRLHAEVSVEGQTIRIADKGSQNGTLLAGRRITEPVVWEPEHEVQVGPFVLRHRWTDRAAAGQSPRDADATFVAADQARAPAEAQELRQGARPAAPAPRQASPQAVAGAGAGAVPGAAGPGAGRGNFPGRLFDQRVVPLRDIQASGKLAAEVDFVAVGGGIGSFCWVDHLRVYGVPASAIRVLGVADDKRPYAKYERLCRNSQIPDDERIRSNSISAPDNVWGFPGYASRELVRDLLQGRLAGLKHVLQVFGEPALTESYTPRTIDVYRSFDVEAKRIGWDDMWIWGQVVGLRKTDDERYVIAYRIPSAHAPDLSPEQRERFIVTRYAQLATGYPASNFLPDLQEFRHAHPNSHAVVNAYEPHDDVYRSLEQKGGTILIRGRGIVASRVIQRVFEARAKNKDIRLLHLVRSQITQGHKYDLARRALRNDVEQQPFNWPKSCWGGTLREKLEKASPEERPKLLAAWGGTTTADRDDWNRIIEAGTKDGWFKVYHGKVASITEKGAKVVTRLESTEGHRENVDLTADFIVDCTGLVARIDETPLLADLIRTYDLSRNRAAGDGAELRLAGLAINTAFEVAGLQNGRGHIWAAGVVTANGPYAAVDSFLGLQYAALRSADHLGQLGAPGVSRFGWLRSSTQWLKWCLGSSP